MIYNFESFYLDPDRRELRHDEQFVAVEPQVFELLHYLICNRDRIVSKDDLIAGVWDGRIVSESTLSSRLTAVRQAVGDSGEAQRLIRTIPRKGFRFIGQVTEQKNDLPLPDSRPIDLPAEHGLRFSDKPSIAVLPFTNLSENDVQEYFVDGVIEDITTALSLFRWLCVTARSSSFAYKGRPVNSKQIGRELNVRYVLEGSVRKAANKFRINAQLVDTMTGTHLWANRFEGAVEDIFDLQDQITASVVGAIGPKLEQVEIERAKRKPTESLDAYDYYLRGVDNVYQWSRDGITNALRLFQNAVEIDPEFAAAYGMAAYCYVQRKSYGWFDDRHHEIAESVRLARRAAELGKDDAVALSRAAHAISYVGGDIDAGADFIDQALELNPNFATGWYVSGWIRIFLGMPEAAIEHLTRARHLSPIDPLDFRVHAGLGYAHFFAGRYDDATAWTGKAVRVRPNYLTGLRGAAASHALAGRLDPARKLMERMRSLDPALRISNLANLLPLRRAEDFTKWANGLRKAGLPE